MRTYAGEDKKWMVTVDWPDFNPSECYFEIVIKDRYGRVRWHLQREDCFMDKDGRLYFVVENVRPGSYYAFFRGSYEDEDYTKQVRVFADEQWLFSCGVRPCPCDNANFAVPSGCKCQHKVHYEEVFEVSIDGEDYLCGSDGKYILTSDGDRICFKNDNMQKLSDMGKVRLDTLTGEEFKQLIEGRSQDGKIDTVPELFDAVRDVPETETVREATEQTYDQENRTLYINGAKPQPAPNEGE